MGYGMCSCDCVCARYSEDGGLCGACQLGDHAGFADNRDSGREHEAVGDYDPPDPMEREP